MKRFITATAWLCCLCLLFLLAASGCSTLPKHLDTSGSAASDTSSDSSPAPTGGKASPFALPYSSMDTLNPFTAKTQNNLALCSLLFDGLTVIDNAFTPQLRLASAVDSTQPLVLTATLRADAKFSDGSNVKPEDVAASFALAKKSPHYKVLLANVKSAQKSGANAVVFALASPDPNASACLSFPVMKSGTDAAPVGSGRYALVKSKDPTLQANRYHGTKASISSVRLLDVSDSKALLYSLESGNISYYYTALSDGAIPNTTQASMNVPLNSLVFLGVNGSDSALSGVAVRTALSLAVSRKEIAASAFAGRATAAVSPFHPQWAAASAIKNYEISENITAAVAQLQQAGYNNTHKKKLACELLITEGNSFRKATADLLVVQLAKAGITCTVTSLPFADYTTRLKKGEFDLYLGEVRLPANMSLSSFFSAGGAAAYGIKSGSATAAYQKYLSGESTLADFCTAFAADMPYIPLCWRQGMAAHGRSLTGITPTGFDIYYGLETWKYQ